MQLISSMRPKFDMDPKDDLNLVRLLAKAEVIRKTFVTNLLLM